MNPWSSLAYWKCGEYQVVREKLDELDKAGVSYNPSRKNLFAALSLVKAADVKVAIIGQDPYPTKSHATGVAFSTPPEVVDYPPTLRNIYREYCSDLCYPAPSNGDLTKWCKEGVLLWNVFPTCETGKPASHRWLEWEYLTKEIVERLDGQQTVFIFLGSIARDYYKYVRNSPVISTSHPSPLGANKGFLGSKIFSRANEQLLLIGKSPVDWRLI